MVVPESSNRNLEFIKETVVGKIFSDIEQEIVTLELEAEEMRKKAWSLDFRIFEIHRMLDEAIDSVAESHRQNGLSLKDRPAAWSVIDNERKA